MKIKNIANRNNNISFLYALGALACLGFGGFIACCGKGSPTFRFACAIAQISMGVGFAKDAYDKRYSLNFDVVSHVLRKSGLMQKAVQVQSGDCMPTRIVGFESKRVISEDMLRSLTYPAVNEGPQTVYSPLQEIDIRRLLTKFDIGFWHETHQRAFLQFILDASAKHPSVARMMRQQTNLICAGYQTVNSDGVASFGYELEHKLGKILLREDINSENVGGYAYHEFVHAVQNLNTGGILLRYANYTSPYLLLTEAHAKAAEQVARLDLDLNQKVVESLLKQEQSHHPTISFEEQKGHAEEKWIGILMKYLLTPDPDERRLLLQRNCGFIFSEEEFTALDNFYVDWRGDYLGCTIQDVKGFIRVHNLAQQSKKDQEAVYLCEKWFSEMTHVPQTMKNKVSQQEYFCMTHGTPSKIYEVER